MQYEFTIKLNQEELDKLLTALEKLPFADVFHLVKKIANQVDDQAVDAAEFEFDMEQAAMNWKPTPPSNMSMEETLQHLQQKLYQAAEKHAKPAAKKPHWTQTPAGKKKMAARKKRGAK